MADSTQYDQSPAWCPTEIPLGDGRTLVLDLTQTSFAIAFKNPAAKNLLGTAGKGTISVFNVNTGAAGPFTHQESNKPTMHSSSVQPFTILNATPLFPPQPTYHPMKASPNTSLKKQIPSSSPIVDVCDELNITMSGVIAHKSALKDGEWMKISQYKL